MLQHRDMPVEKLQYEIVDALQAAARGRIGGIARKLLKLVVDPADHPIDPAVDHRVRAAYQHRRHELLVEYDLLVANLQNAGDAEPDITGFGGLAQLVAQPRIGDVDFFLDPQRGS